MDRYDRLIELGRLKDKLIIGLCSDLSRNRILSGYNDDNTLSHGELIHRHCEDGKLNTSKPSELMIEMVAELFPLMAKLFVHDETDAGNVISEMYRYLGYDVSKEVEMETANRTISLNMTLDKYRDYILNTPKP